MCFFRDPGAAPRGLPDSPNRRAGLPCQPPGAGSRPGMIGPGFPPAAVDRPSSPGPRRICRGRHVAKERALVQNAMAMRTVVLAAIAGSIATSALAQTQPRGRRPTRPLRRCHLLLRRVRSIPAARTRHSIPRALLFRQRIPDLLRAVAIGIQQTISKSASEGANSLSGDQAKSRIEAKGYLNISGLEQDNRGIWRGKRRMLPERTIARSR